MGDGKIPESFNRNNVEYLIVGGVAVAFHGCRRTNDIHDLDILINPTIENSEKVYKSLSECGVHCNDPSPELAKHKKQMPIKWGPYDIDILTPEKSIQFSDLLARSLHADVDGIKVRIIGKEDLITMKICAVSTGGTDSEKHAIDLECLHR